jgi:hypothetical protein
MDVRVTARKPRRLTGVWGRMTASVACATGVLAFAAGSPRAEEGEPTARPTAAALPSPAAVRGSAFVDPLGFLLFGPTLGVEIGIGQYSVVAFGRWLDGGWLAKSMFENDTDKFAFSFGGGLKGRYYFGAGLVGPHLGLAVELLKTRTENHVDLVAVNNLILVPELEAGYRYGLGRFFAGVTLALGYAQQVSKTVENIEDGNQADFFYAKDVSTFYATGSLDLGLLF